KCRINSRFTYPATWNRPALLNQERQDLDLERSESTEDVKKEFSLFKVTSDGVDKSALEVGLVMFALCCELFRFDLLVHLFKDSAKLGRVMFTGICNTVAHPVDFLPNLVVE